MQEIETRSGWLTREQLRDARERLPILYVNLVPVRVDERSQVTQIGLLLRASETGEIQRELVSGRVLYHERLRDAVLRHIERDLGPMALPQVPIAPQPFAVAEYFPTPGVTPFHDPRQHAVALAYVVVLMGDCQPQGNALDLAWLTPAEASELATTPEMVGGHGVLLRQALAHLGHPI
ncbi:MAG TPA: NUDIX hydrolase family protein [Dermatophilaceae bacterium]|jgi:ADP-ribose pyrophosphatase YjhB (NUDIX family)|nr:NUDIX hydrolase family protein [Dermatophilaceae bacterium]HPZ68315.1 NUDIX hydrolase family protein [Dermatophilaceae bacterium]HQD00592.1 NUDIX hydrolase family protein [Dermatophilaceae bacterium]